MSELREFTHVVCVESGTILPLRTARLVNISDELAASGSDFDIACYADHHGVRADATPDLLATLRNIAANLGAEAIRRNDHVAERIADSRERAANAIAKATGKQPQEQA